MAVELAVGTPLAEALQSVVQPKLAEIGWSTGGADDSALSEYIILMLVNGKTQDQIASELANDLLGLGAEDSGAIDFSRWLFEQVEIQNARLNGASSAQAAPQVGATFASGAQSSLLEGAAQDAEMGDSTAATIPTGPKAMRNGNQNAREKRMLGHLNKAMDRSHDAALHRVRGGAGAGRINAHSGREPPRGPRNQANRQQAIMNGLGGMPGMPGMNGMGMSVAGNMSMMPPPGMTPEHHMDLMKMWEQTAASMANLSQHLAANGMPVQPFINPAFQKNQRSGKSLFERVDRSSRKNRPQQSGRQQQQHQDAEMGEAEQTATSGENAESMDVEEKKNPYDVLCKFNHTCGRPDCPFAHQSPAANPGVAVDLSDDCSFGIRCKNFKCTGKHPSPAQKAAHHQEQVCKYHPHCANPHCQFQHPADTKPLCRNGGDCTTPGCQFTHTTIKCRFNPCTNAHCKYKHDEGQKKAAPGDNVWMADGAKEHVSERKFVDETQPEELILPGAEVQMQQTEAPSAAADDIVT